MQREVNNKPSQGICPPPTPPTPTQLHDGQSPGKNSSNNKDVFTPQF